MAVFGLWTIASCRLVYLQIVLISVVACKLPKQQAGSGDLIVPVVHWDSAAHVCHVVLVVILSLSQVSLLLQCTLVTICNSP